MRASSSPTPRLAAISCKKSGARHPASSFFAHSSTISRALSAFIALGARRTSYFESTRSAAMKLSLFVVVSRVGIKRRQFSAASDASSSTCSARARNSSATAQTISSAMDGEITADTPPPSSFNPPTRAPTALAGPFAGTCRFACVQSFARSCARSSSPRT